MNQKYILSGIILVSILFWVSVALTVSRTIGSASMFESSNDAGHHGMHDDDSWHHGMMDGDDHGTDECDEYDTHAEEGYDCENYDYEDYCNQTVNNMDC